MTHQTIKIQCLLTPGTNLKVMRTAPDESMRRKLSGSSLGWRAAIAFALALRGGDGICEVGQGGCFRLNCYAFFQPLDCEHNRLIHQNAPLRCDKPTAELVGSTRRSPRGARMISGLSQKRRPEREASPAARSRCRHPPIGRYQSRRQRQPAGLAAQL